MVHIEEKYQIPRDFEGFGEEGFDPQWPNGARIAVSFVLNYEEGGERSVLDGDKMSEPYLWEKGASGGYKENARYLNAEQDFEYGSRVASWRLIRLFREFGWNFTTYAVAVALAKNPTFAKALVRDGHEIAAHGYRWLDVWDLSLEEDKEYIKKTLLLLKEVSGEMPVGAYFGRGTPQTHALFPEVWKELGAEFLWSSEVYNDDVPYWLDLPWEKSLKEEERTGMLLIPYNYDCNDGKFHMAPGFGSSVAESYENYLKNTFDMLYREGGKMMNIPLHTRIIGKPGRCEALRKFMKYIADKPGVWVTTRRDIARHYNDKFPYQPDGKWIKKYIKALEDRVAELEIRLETPSATQQQDAAIQSQATQRNALGEIAEFLTLGHFEGPAYVGSSSGFSLALNLREMVQASVWNKALTTADAEDGSASEASASSSRENIRLRPLTLEEIRTKSAGPPSEEEGLRLISAFFTRVAPRYPFMDWEEMEKLHSDRLRLSSGNSLSRRERFGTFKLYLVYAIGSSLLALTEKIVASSSEHISAARESRSIHNIEAMTLLVIYHLRSSASSQGLWYMIGLAMRTCIDLGLHRRNKEVHRDAATNQRYRTLFWTVYSLERTIAISLGRPVSIADRHIDVDLPDVAATSSPPSPVKNSKNQSNSMAIHLFRIRILESRIHHSIYRTDKPLSALRQKLAHHYRQLEEWKMDLLRLFPHVVDLDYPILHYNRAMRLLLQPFLSILPCTDPYYINCLESALQICHIHKRLHQTLDYGHSFIAVQTVFVAGITLLFCVWTKASHVWSVKISNGIRACSNVLFVMGERTLWVKKYRDAFELLTNATMEKLQGNLKEEAGILETALSVSGSRTIRSPGDETRVQ
ncbi:hypothetical protein UA08_03182 [Talaromyces atroroseus]|uniref:NodB homology domain-containing protein n=1 Tax=Talaromyces atroroseus TaxID=1441469 RepID=A0A225APW8_TALAT|nr:hypothetical protein UA08_03182 [Talaromyces atroroseus]OKL61543.1 hypothetical protein UA08_03182 [Talaromyces atroroseus]